MGGRLLVLVAILLDQLEQLEQLEQLDQLEQLKVGWRNVHPWAGGQSLGRLKV